MNETKQKGLITELHCQLDFSELGILLSAPICEDSRYDYIADINGQLIRIQCKTCSVGEDGSYIKFSTRSTRSNTGQSYQRYYTKEEIDYFYTSYDNQGYLVKVEETSSEKTLRFSSLSTNQNITWAKDQEIENVLKRDFNYLPSYNKINIISNNNNNYCVDCGKIIDARAVRCQECYALSQRTVERPNRETLKELIRTTPFVQIAKQYKVSDKAIVKWCIAENLPSKKADIKKYSDEDWRQV